ncbi:MAG: addiction module antidote protein, HigA family [Salinisphaeraceae bacterium]|nr:addiction module antidote protein, HigA family [Salinisphaeraceae bacterium]
MPMHNPVHPGRILKEEILEPLGISAAEAARRLKLKRGGLSRVLNEHAAVSPSLAIRLEMAGVSTARMWLKMQSAYDCAKERRKPAPNVQRLVPENDRAAGVHWPDS